MPWGPVTPTARPSSLPASRADRSTEKASASLLSSPKQITVAGREELAQEGFERLALAAGRPRAEIDHEAAPVMGQVVLGQLAIGRLDRRFHGRARRGPILGLTDVKGDRWSLVLDEQPRRAPEELRHAAGEPLGRLDRRVMPRLERGGQALRPPAAGVVAELEAVVAEVADPADPDPRSGIGRGPAGQDRDGQPLRPCRGDAGQPAQRDPGQRNDRGRGRVARALGQRAVEVGQDEQAAGPIDQPRQ